MFELYTEKARRAIFFARYEAATFGSPTIDTAHMLLGLIRDSAATISRYLHQPVDAEIVRARIRGYTAVLTPQPTSVDLPLSELAKHVVAYAAEEADLLSHQRIGTEHLFLGLLRDEQDPTAKLLQEMGASLERARASLAKSGMTMEQSGLRAGVVGGMGTGTGFSGELRRSLTLHLFDEDGSALDDIQWQTRVSRLPQIGESLQVSRDGETTLYRVLDLIWQVGQSGDVLMQNPEVGLRVRVERPARGGA